MNSELHDLLGQVDVVFVIDTTSSMLPYIEASRMHAKRLADEIASSGGLDIRLAIVEYRDHPPQEGTFVTNVHMFGTSELFQQNLDQLSAYGGGDIPEAVFDGLIEASRLNWREQADRICFLIGDAPPHGYLDRMGDTAYPWDARLFNVSDCWPEGCPCRATAGGVIETLRGNRIKLHTINIGPMSITSLAFNELATGAEGTFTEAYNPEVAIKVTESVYAATDLLVHEAREYSYAVSALGSADPEALSTYLGWSTEMVAGARAYMSSRGIEVEPTVSVATDDLNRPPVETHMHDLSYPGSSLNLPETDITSSIIFAPDNARWE